MNHKPFSILRKKLQNSQKMKSTTITLGIVEAERIMSDIDALSSSLDNLKQELTKFVNTTKEDKLEKNNDNSYVDGGTF